MFTRLMYWLVSVIARLHDYFLKINDYTSVPLNDKELHFLIIGVLGILILWVIYPLFKFLAKRNHVMVIAWIYVFTLMIVLTFAIEIGQGITHTGSVEMVDVVAGLAGFMAMFFAFSIIRMLYHVIRDFIVERKEKAAKKAA